MFFKSFGHLQYLNALRTGEVKVETVVGTADNAIDDGAGSNVFRLADLHGRVLGGKALGVVFVHGYVGHLALEVLVDHLDALLDFSGLDVRDDSTLGFTDARAVDNHVSRFSLGRSLFLRLVEHFQSMGNQQMKILDRFAVERFSAGHQVSRCGAIG